MSKQHDDFPIDEFETPQLEFRRPGVHRTKKSVWRKVMPFLLVTVLCAALGVGSVFLLTRNPDSRVAEYLGEVAGTESASPEPSQSPAEEPADEEPAADSDAGEGTIDEPVDTPSEEPTADPSDQPTTEPTGEPTEPATAEIDRTSSVRVLNAGARQGTAGALATKFKNDGWTTVEAANFEGNRPSSSVVYYRGSENLANAEHIAELAGISNLLEVDSLRADISVILLRQ
ncbi:LytR C-terminal domain-containing protein [Jonesiaceae bacterium BS-20]|uniref:LytR C-terminal domain-containing protein n=1 Tax=Jonesiaceae bacterium BS-20 TaxID=3120821 RepID=A0AAU7DVR6_9MICO